jgi:hypothetical protein
MAFNIPIGPFLLMMFMGIVALIDRKNRTLILLISVEVNIALFLWIVVNSRVLHPSEGMHNNILPTISLDRRQELVKYIPKED